MGLIREPRNVDFSTKSRPLTEEEHKEISEYIKKSKAKRQAYLKRKARKKEKAS